MMQMGCAFNISLHSLDGILGSGADCDALLHTFAAPVTASPSESAGAGWNDLPATCPDDGPSAGARTGARAARAVCHPSGCWAIARGVTEGEHMLRLALVDATGLVIFYTVTIIVLIKIAGTG